MYSYTREFAYASGAQARLQTTQSWHRRVPCSGFPVPCSAVASPGSWLRATPYANAQPQRAVRAAENAKPMIDMPLALKRSFTAGRGAQQLASFGQNRPGRATAGRRPPQRGSFWRAVSPLGAAQGLGTRNVTSVQGKVGVMPYQRNFDVRFCSARRAFRPAKTGTAPSVQPCAAGGPDRHRAKNRQIPCRWGLTRPVQLARIMGAPGGSGRNAGPRRVGRCGLADAAGEAHSISGAGPDDGRESQAVAGRRPKKRRSRPIRLLTCGGGRLECPVCMTGRRWVGPSVGLPLFDK